MKPEDLIPQARVHKPLQNMRFTTRQHLVGVVMSSLLCVVLAACQVAEVTMSRPAMTDFLFAARPIPTAVSQALVIDERGVQGMTLHALAATDIYTIPTVDFYGAPFTPFNVSAPRDIINPWTFASSLLEADWASADDASPWHITITGASTARSPVSQNETGLGSFYDMYKTVVALGGPSKLKEVIAASATTYLLRDTSGKLWDPVTQTIAHPEIVNVARTQYDELIASNAKGVGGTGGQAARMWEPYLNGELAQRATRATEASGELEIAAYTSHLQPRHRQPDASGYIRGAIPRGGSSNVYGLYPAGSQQETVYFGRSGNWDYYHCDGGRVPVRAIGCGPAAFAGLLNFHFEKRGRVINGLKHTSISSTGATGVEMLRRVTEHMGYPAAKPVLVAYLGTCWLYTGGATAANAFAAGISKFIKERAPGMGVTYHWSRGSANYGGATAKVDILKWATWRSSAGWPRSRSSEVPVLAEYWPQAGVGHYSAVREWRYRQANAVSRQLEVSTQDHPRL